MPPLLRVDPPDQTCYHTYHADLWSFTTPVSFPALLGELGGLCVSSGESERAGVGGCPAEPALEEMLLEYPGLRQLICPSGEEEISCES